VIEEAKAMGDDYVGTEHLLLFLARVGVPDVGLSYEQIRNIILELRAPAILHARHASASEAGDYFQVIFVYWFSVKRRLAEKANALLPLVFVSV
jgi:hypothetical protein